MSVISQEDEKHARAVLSAFYGDSFNSRGRVNERVIELLAEIIEEASQCTKQIDLVPKPVGPVGAKPGISWALKQVAKLGKQLVRTPSLKISLICKKHIALVYRTDMELAFSY
ncbi:hypothetical protein QCD60_12345 [Pokkaliibacter sp. MBI-7]|uniref:hypothetical protein n=1 Tax=Pokkaliibacter sp. MBI-7 TaxID=3040600 RepID=UPI002446E91D|nr:hypothetical protein [Pokkaliibacter sp. MBI-7]MDH2433361.1 hypothetical protein [Pokkaliibacter sp. MBI-7]